MIRSIWTEISSFIAGLFVASIVPDLAYSGHGADTYFLSALFFGLITYLLIYRMIRNRPVALALAVLGIAYWGGLVAAGLGFAYILFGGIEEWSVGLWAYMIIGTVMAVLAYRGRAAFDARASDFPTI